MCTVPHSLVLVMSGKGKETAAQKEARLAKHRERKRVQRAAESQQQREKRLKNNREKMAAKTFCETEKQRKAECDWTKTVGTRNKDSSENPTAERRETGQKDMGRA